MCLTSQCQTYCATMTLVPNIVGQLWGDAAYQLSGLNLTLGQVTGTNDPNLKVTAQSVSPGAEVPRGTPVAVKLQDRPANYVSSVLLRNWLNTPIVVWVRTNGAITVVNIIGSGVASVLLQNGIDYSFRAYCNQGPPPCCDAYAPNCGFNYGLQSAECIYTPGYGNNGNICWIGPWGPTWHGDSAAGQLSANADQYGIY